MMFFYNKCQELIDKFYNGVVFLRNIYTMISPIMNQLTLK